MRLLKIFKSRIFAFLLVLLVLGGGGYYYSAVRSPAAAEYKTAQEQDVFVRFVMEGYDIIAGNYWQKAPDTDMSQLFQLSLQRAQNATTLPALPTPDRRGTAQMLEAALDAAETPTAKKELAVNVLVVAAANLAPAGRSGLLSSGQLVELQQTVANINPEKDLYADLGVEAGASPAAVEVAFQEKKLALESVQTPEALAELQKAEYAHEVLTDESTKVRYDEAKIEPTVFAHRFGSTLYLYLTQMSPTTLQEFGQEILAASSSTGLSELILDLRGNIGGALDIAPATLGLFVGQNQYAFDFFHQGEYMPQRTTLAKFPELTRYKEIAVLTDNMTQSTAEILTAALKRYNLGVVVGGTTRGWGSVEGPIEIKTELEGEKYSLLLVQHLLLRDDNEPIEARGVDPDVSLATPNWQSLLGAHFRSANLIATVKKVLAGAPLK